MKYKINWNNSFSVLMVISACLALIAALIPPHDRPILDVVLFIESVILFALAGVVDDDIS